MIEVRVLGPVEVRAGADTMTGSDRRQAVLAMLVAARGRVVPADRLADQLWNGAPPPSATVSLQAYVSRLRRLLEPDRPPRAAPSVLVSEAAGYALRLPGDAVDAWNFERAVLRAPDLPPPEALETLQNGLAWWRGSPYEQFADEPWAQGEINRLAELRRTAQEREVEAMLRVGRTADAVPAATALTEAEPLRGEAFRLLALSLWAAHRSSDALDVLRRHRLRMADELGLDAEPVLSDLEQAIREQRLDVLAEAMRQAVRPAQLPRSGTVFEGRQEELTALDTSTLSVITGPGGVGKTTLALRWAHRAAERYEDGQLYADLRGFGPEDAPADPGDVLFSFLLALGVPDHRVPPGRTERVALFRSVLAGRRMLLVLDNARDADQVRPLLPGSPGCAVVVTGRGALQGLVVADGALPVPLDAFGDDEARDYLRVRLGAAVDAYPEARDAIVARCGGLPLALALVAARAATFPLPAVAAELAEEEGLESLPDLRSVFSWSYRHLAPDEADLFRLLALHPGPDLTVPAVDAVTGLGRPGTRALLRRLRDAHLLIESQAGRFRFHDLLRAYARELTASRDTEQDRRRVVLRLVEHHLYSAGNASAVLYPYRSPDRLGPGPAEAAAVAFADRAAAFAWMDAEYGNLLALTEVCPKHLGRFAWALASYQQDLRYFLDDSIDLARRALEVAREDDDPWWVGFLHYLIGRGHLRLNRRVEARADLERAIEVGRQTGDPLRLAHGLLSVALCITGVHEVPSRQQAEAAFPYATEARELYRAMAQPLGRVEEANTLHPIGWYHYYQPGGREKALRYFRESVEINVRLSHLHGAASSWMQLARMLQVSGRIDEAVAAFEEALELYGDVPGLRIEPLIGLYTCHRALADDQKAQRARSEALGLLETARYPDIARLRSILGVKDRLSDNSGNESPSVK
jgi:DNA-binding SARP family transcriptional activator/tetratricopeptide (TPR) repeat protein